jgi:hypothetical protein
MAHVTFGKSRVRESRMLGSVRAKPNGFSYSTINEVTHTLLDPLRN